MSVSFVVQYAVTMESAPAGGGYTSPAGTVWVTAGSAIPIQAQPAASFAFLQWSTSGPAITIADPSSASTSITVEGSGTVTAQFYQTVVTTTTSTTSTTTSTTSTTTSPSTSTAQTTTQSHLVVPPNWVIVSGVAVAFVLIVVVSLLVRRRVR